MEVAPGASAAVRNGGVGVSMPLMSSASSQPSRKEWRVVSEQSVRNSSNELECAQEMDRAKLGQSDERLIYEVQHGREPLDVDFCSMTIEGSLDHDILQQRLHTVAKQREELQHIEVDLRAQVIARSEIVALQNSFDAQLKEHSNAIGKFQEQLREKEDKLRELERKLDEKERELHAIRLDNEAAWAKEDLLREQSKELQSYRRERDNSEAERAQHIKQIHDLREHVQEKERQFVDLQEQHRIAQETILYKDEQLREAQAWMTRAQEMDALQSTTNHSLQAELRDRAEQYNQLWLGYQQQYGDMEKLHLHIQQLQLELVDAREKSGIPLDDSHISHSNSNDVSQVRHANGSPLELNDSNLPKPDNANLQNGNSESSGGNSLTQADQVHGVAFAPSSLFGMPTYIPTAMHPFVMHQQGVPHPSHVTQSHFHALPAMSSIQNWQNQQALPDGDHAPTQNHYAEQSEENLLRMDSQYDFEASTNGQVINTTYIDTASNPGKDANVLVPTPNGEGQVHDSIDESHGKPQAQPTLQQISSHFIETLRLDTIEHGNDIEEKKANPVGAHGLENKISVMEPTNVSINLSSSEAPTPTVNFSESSDASSNAVLTSAFVPTGQKSNAVAKSGEPHLLDERALLASIARAIGVGGRIRISSTLPNRLAKMLAPLHWHDYKKMYGKLDEFVANHPDLFLIEGDYIHLREGALEVIAATAAVAKVAAAAAAPPSSYSSSVPSVALTPMSQSYRLKKVPSIDSSSVNSSNSVSHASFLEIQNQNFGGDSFHVAGGVPNVKILSKTKDNEVLNGSETRPSRHSLLTVGNGMNSNRNELSQSKGAFHGRHNANLVGKLQSRSMGASSGQRR